MIKRDKQMQAILSEAQARPRLSQVPLDSLDAVWSGLCSTLASSLRTGKGVTIENFGTFSFHVDYIDLGNQKKTQSTAVFELSEKFKSLYHVRSPKQPAGISSTVPVKNLNLIEVARACGQPREIVSAVVKDLVIHVGEKGMSGTSFRLDFPGVGTWMCQGGQSRFQFAPTLAGTIVYWQFGTSAQGG